jgi:hypothetical protein
MDLALLSTLKEKLIQATDFTPVFEYFMDHFGEDPDFIALGERAQHPFLAAVLDRVGKELFGKPVPLTDLLLVRLPEHQFLHGGCILGGKLANVLYFEDGSVGLLAVAMSMSPGETRLVRFTGQPLPAAWKPSEN